MAIASRQLPPTPSPPAGGWTVEAIFDLPEDGQRYELIDGELLVTPPPKWHHQAVVSNLIHLLWPPAGTTIKTLGAPLGWRPPGRSRWLEPDVSVVDVAALALADRWVTQPPLLVVEVASSSTRQRDRTLKRRVYDEDGALGYWLVEPDPAAPAVTVFERPAAGGSLLEVDTVEGDAALNLDHPWPLRVVPADLVR